MRIAHSFILFLALVLLGSCGVDETASDQPLGEQYENLVSKALEEFNVPGAAVAVVKDDKLYYSKGFGFRNVGEKLPVTPETLFAIGSTTKAFTATALAILSEEGKLDFDAPVKKYLPSFQLEDAFATERASARDLLVHRTGLPNHDLVWYGSSLTRQEMFDRLRYLSPSVDFRAKWQYNNLMYMTAGVLVGEIAKTTWEEFTRKRILEPLGMLHTNLSVLDSQKTKDFAMPYRLDAGGKLVEIPFRNLDAIGPAGAINSNLVDMAKWVRFQLGGAGERLLRPQTLKELQRPEVLVPEEPLFPELGQTTYAMGWFNQTYRQQRLVWHSGGIDGFRTLVTLLPDQKIGIIAFVNSESREVPRVVTYSLIDELLQLEKLDWTEKSKAALAKKKTPTAPKFESKPMVDPVASYAGTFAHPAYGNVEVKVTDGKLRLLFRRDETELVHVGERKFFFAKAMSEKDYVSFSAAIDVLDWQLVPELKNPLHFRRVN